MLIGTMSSGILFGIGTALAIWGAGHHPLAIGLGYSIGGMIGAVAFAGIFGRAANTASVRPH
jgi:hypothetical protein